MPCAVFVAVEVCAPAALGGRALVRVGACDVTAEIEAMLCLRAARREAQAADAASAAGAPRAPARAAFRDALARADDECCQPDERDAAAMARAQACALLAHEWLTGAAAEHAHAAAAVAALLPADHGLLWAHWVAELRRGRCFEAVLHACAALERALAVASAHGARAAGRPLAAAPLLKDLVASADVRAALGAGVCGVCRTLCAPALLNLRNLAWHGFLPAVRWDRLEGGGGAELAPYAALVLALVAEVAEVLAPATAARPPRPEAHKPLVDLRAADELWSRALAQLDAAAGGAPRWRGVPADAADARRAHDVATLLSLVFLPAGFARCAHGAVDALHGAQPARSAALALVALEAALRAAYGRLNRGERARACAERHRYYVTLDGYGQRRVHQLLLAPRLLARGRAPNLLARALRGAPATLIADLLLRRRGPAVRARLAHGDAALLLPRRAADERAPAVVSAVWYACVLCACALDSVEPAPRPLVPLARELCARAVVDACDGGHANGYYAPVCSGVALLRAAAERCAALAATGLSEADASTPAPAPTASPPADVLVEVPRVGSVRVTFRPADAPLLARAERLGGRALEALRARAGEAAERETAAEPLCAAALRVALGGLLEAAGDEWSDDDGDGDGDGDGGTDGAGDDGEARCSSAEDDAGAAAAARARTPAVGASLAALQLLARLATLEGERAASAAERARARLATSAQRRQLVLGACAAPALRRVGALALVGAVELAAGGRVDEERLGRGAPAGTRLLSAAQGMLAAAEAGKGLDEQLGAAEAMLALLLDGEPAMSERAARRA